LSWYAPSRIYFYFLILIIIIIISVERATTPGRKKAAKKMGTKKLSLLVSQVDHISIGE
jgi:hypothetical membrane protein